MTFSAATDKPRLMRALALKSRTHLCPLLPKLIESGLREVFR